MPKTIEPILKSEQLEPWVQLHDLISSGDAKVIRAFLEKFEPAETLRAFSRLSAEDQQELLTVITPNEAAEILIDMSDENAADLVEQLASKDAAIILEEMDSNEQADIVADLNEVDAEAILAEMDPAEAAEVRTLATYPDDEAGGLMVTEFVSFEEIALISDVINYLRQHAEQRSEFEAHIYVTSDKDRLLGVLSLRELLLVPLETALKQIMKQPYFVTLTATLDELDDFFGAHDFFGVPVVDEASRLVGVVRRQDVLRAVAERADIAQLKTKGIVIGEETRTMPTFIRSRRRLSWLSINIILNVISASVIALFTDTLSAVIALAVFLPIVSDMSGCSGNQAVAVSMRELSLGLVKPFEVLHVWLQEIKVGLINGTVLGILIGLVALAWKGNPFLGLVVGLALALNTIVAVSIGGTVPLILKWLKIDPAVASGPVLTTITDLFGFFLVLSIATIMLPLLV